MHAEITIGINNSGILSKLNSVSELKIFAGCSEWPVALYVTKAKIAA